MWSLSSYHTVITAINTSTPVHTATVSITTVVVASPPLLKHQHCQQHRCRDISVFISTSLIHASIIATMAITSSLISTCITIFIPTIAITITCVTLAYLSSSIPSSPSHHCYSIITAPPPPSPSSSTASQRGLKTPS